MSVYACVGHRENWCTGYNDGFSAGNGGSIIYYEQRNGPSIQHKLSGDNNKIIVDQQSGN